MGKNNFNKSYLKDLYESLSVSESAKKRFFEEYLKEDMAQQPQTAEVKKAGIINKFLSFINKRTPTVEQSVQKMMEALTGMEEVINRGSTDDAVKEQHKAILAKYKGQIANATKGLVDANTKYDEAKNRFVQSNPKLWSHWPWFLHSRDRLALPVSVRLWKATVPEASTTSSTVTARLMGNPAAMVRRREDMAAPQPSACPISWQRVRI